MGGQPGREGGVLQQRSELYFEETDLEGFAGKLQAYEEVIRYTDRLRELPGGQKILLTDTVGFIRKLPHHLIEAFKSTWKEARYADILIHVADVSSPQMDEPDAYCL